VSAAISVRGLTKRFGPILAVDDLSFDVQAGRAVGFLGPNGAGKTTTLRVLLGLADPSSGTALVQEQRYAGLAEPARTVGAGLEGAAFHPGRSGRDHLRVLASASALPATRADDVLRVVDLERAGRRRVKGYSLGMRQRLALAAALLGDPPVLILDEPANGLDPPGIRWLRDMLRAEVTGGRTVLVSSHVLAEVAQTVDDVVVINHGRLVASGPLAEVTGGDRAVHVRATDAGRLAEGLDARGMSWERRGDDGLAVFGASTRDVGEAALERQVVLLELGHASQSLEDVFLELIGGDA
jgi:ABC-2 type transport system ATP-binding protein